VLSVKVRTRTPRVTSSRPVPHVKIMRLLTHLLSAERDLEIESVRIHADSGCSDLTGVIDVICTDATRRFSFQWDCAWRAREQGWTDCFGFPDQIRAADEFGWNCFQRWQLSPSGSASTAGTAAR
jgi:hypothetical protein